MTSSWHSPQSIYAFGHKALETLFDGPVLVQEKIDGSFFAFGLYEDGIRCRSKGQQIVVAAPDKMFAPGVETTLRLAPSLTPGFQYRGEFLAKPKHNALAYQRAPAGHIILFDICRGEEDYLLPEEAQAEAMRLGLEYVPTYHYGELARHDAKLLLERFLTTESCLGGPKVEGVVVKNYAQFGRDKKVLMGKFVSAEYLEVHKTEWKVGNPGISDVVTQIIDTYRTPARWAKAVQHLRDAGQLDESPRDIGPLIKEVPVDVKKECEDEIKAKLWTWAWPKISRGLTVGLPEWYKQSLFDRQFVARSEEQDEA